ncbi:MAG: isocitrate/isopropylmalate dehydrogenase family protein [Planctomycetota bacterium]
MRNYRIVGLPGDGIGPECYDAAIQVMSAAANVCDVSIDVQRCEAGAEHHRQHGTALPEEVLSACMDADAVLLAAIGLPDVRNPDGTEVQPQMMMGLRRAMGLYAAVRPVKLFPGVASPLNTGESGIDMVIIRENLEGLFASFGGGCQLNDQLATDTIVITREGTRRVVDLAFRLSQKRNGRPLDGKRRVSCVDKANVFRSFAFFRKVFFEVAAEYPDIEADAQYVDAMSLYMVTTPSEWDVLVMENQFGDILSDLGAAIVGGLGLGPSAEIGDDRALFQPSHGTAPQIAGKNIANPIATILSAAMMFEWLGDRHGDTNLARAARLIEASVAQSLDSGKIHTADQGGTATTSQVANEVTKTLTAEAATSS